MSHVEIASKDPAATQKFLETTFGWKFTVMPEMGYAMHGVDEGAEDASVGVRALMGPEAPGTVGYTFVADIDAAIKDVQSAGGKVVQAKQEVPGQGWLAVYVAPGGVALGLFQNK